MARLQIKSAHAEFVNFIKLTRPNSQNLDELADGRVLDARTALENNLIDSLGTVDDALTYLITEILHGNQSPPRRGRLIFFAKSAQNEWLYGIHNSRNDCLKLRLRSADRWLFRYPICRTENILSQVWKRCLKKFGRRLWLTSMRF